METWKEQNKKRSQSIIIQMTNIYIWVRTARSLQFFYPIIDIREEKDDPFGIYYDICLQIIDLFKETDRISFDEFENICKEKIPEFYVEAIFQNAVEHGNLNARLKLLIFSLLFAGLQQKTENSSSDLTRPEIVLERISKYFGPIFKLLFQLDVEKRLHDRDIVHAIGNGQGYEFLDMLFEGTVKHRHSNQHGVRPLSHIIPQILEKANSISLPFLCNEIKRHLIKDPYHIDEFSNEKSNQIISTTARRTTLAHNSRRVVHLHFINRIEVLRKDEFANIHLRICNDKPKASFVFVPLRCETVFLDSLFYTKWIVLGAVQGIVIIRNCQGTRISVSFFEWIMENGYVEIRLSKYSTPYFESTI
uniref:C-CAP/cofactor C-like domain-containing protein n=2 Tax=Caenorhabditis tropicalis TaxID=1561998 RepID=A0A1I7UM29_9PELO